MEVKSLLALLEKVRATGPNSWMARCPSHDDHEPSLSIRQEGDRILLHCFAGCTVDEIVRALGIGLSDLNTASGSPPISEETGAERGRTFYTYVDEAGTPLFRVVRTQLSPREKRFTVEHSERNRWLPGLGNARRVLYRLDEIARAPDDAIIFVTEGEKDSDRLASLGLVATTCPFGAGKWRDSYSQFLRGRRVVVIPDNDEPGLSHADDVLRAIAGSASSFGQLQLPGLPPKGDVSDFLDGGGTANDLLTRAEKTLQPPDPTGSSIDVPCLVTAADLAEMDIAEPRWVVRGFLPEGLLVLVGAPKIGKSWLALQLNSCVASRRDSLGAVECLPGIAIYFGLEDTPRRLKSRLQILGESSDGLLLATRLPPLSDGCIESIEKILRAYPSTRVIVIDTLARIRDGGDQGRDLYQRDYAAIGQLKAITDLHGIALVLLHHTNKAKEEWPDPLDAVSGTRGLSGAADTVAVLTRNRGTQEGKYQIAGRDVPEDSIDLIFDGGLWRLAGEYHGLSDERRGILQLLQRQRTWMKPHEIAEALDRDTNAVNKLLLKMSRDGQVERRKPGEYRAPNSGQSTPSSQTADENGPSSDALTGRSSLTSDPEGGTTATDNQVLCKGCDQLTDPSLLDGTGRCPTCVENEVVPF